MLALYKVFGVKRLRFANTVAFDIDNVNNVFLFLLLLLEIVFIMVENKVITILLLILFKIFITCIDYLKKSKNC